ncbi:3-ketoacyl-ACP reductase [Microbacterium thalassium]|uniref:NAD(P)-dependent dehydrogenase (Short-subunit alcohol dehydrogenase family) n=1 Tax=Microbacterium thalassium TaxID=362649 RepID=A0A7X0FN81_9MICO|nr:3-ketoacyl-ACP reductase [Microbacterium thalassium]MBB6390593.1 NAD(P)-dependent dehydrogenase (short-subunit alcohol dehydrogenase family) [Microbacterium thalassium]GLK25703.1 3-ketoacyl-ACP reductase [Microbacterium thalassium]
MVQREVDAVRPVALVTGARQGLGRATAVRLAADGFDVVAADIADVDDTVAAIRAAGGGAHGVRADIADVDAIGSVVTGAWAAFGRIDCLVNNAGLASRPLTDILDITPEMYDRVVAVNQRGTFFLTQEVARRMVAAASSDHHRSIITVSSIASRMVNLERSPYHLSKAALSMLNELFAVRLAEHGIAAYEVRPGYMRTDMTASAVPQKLDDVIRAGRVPARRWGTPEDVAATVSTLASGSLPFSTGQAVWVDGGLHIHRAD